jgi:hypothetical protein
MPLSATLGNDATLGDNNAKLGNDAMPLLTTAVMMTTTTAAVAATAAVARTMKTVAVTYRQQSTKRDRQFNNQLKDTDQDAVQRPQQRRQQGLQ